MELRILEVLRANPRGCAARAICRRLGNIPEYVALNALRRLQEERKVELRDGSRWQAKTLAPAVVRSAPVLDGLSCNPPAKGTRPFQPQRRSVLAPNRWKAFRRLCLYYAECSRLAEGTQVRVYADQEGKRFLSLPGRIDWRAVCGGSPLAISLPEDWPSFTRWVKSNRTPQLFLGGPVDVFCGRDADKGEEYKIVSPVFVLQVDCEVREERLLLTPRGEVAINHGWIERRFKKPDDRRAFLELCGLEMPDRGDGGDEATRPPPASFPELFQALRQYYRSWWQEPPDIDSVLRDPPLTGASDSGLYNRMVLVAQPAQQYSARLCRELRHISDRATDEELDASALALLFPHEPPAPSRAEPRPENGQGAGSKDSFPQRNPQTTPILTEVAELDPLNASQRHACSFATDAHLSVVTGPPGTGKSRVVAHAMANAALNRQTVLFASKNHQAIEAVVPRLNACVEPDTLVIRLNRPFGEVAEDVLLQVLNVMFSRPKPANITEQRERALEETAASLADLRELNHRLHLIYDLHVRLESAEWHLGDLLLEWPEFDAKVRDAPAVPAPEQVKTLAELMGPSDERGLGWIRRLLRRWARRREQRRRLPEAMAVLGEFRKTFGSHDTASGPTSEIEIGSLAKNLHEWLSIAEAVGYARQTKELQASLRPMPRLEDLYERHRSMAQQSRALAQRAVMLLAQAYGAQLEGQEKQQLAEIWAGLRVHGGGEGGGQAARRFRRAFHERFPTLLRHIPLWATTNLSVGKHVPLVAGAFDLLVVDEASQCDIASVVPLLFRAKRVMVVGDPMQLPHVMALSRSIDARLRQNLELTDTTFERFDYRISFFEMAATSASLPNERQVRLCEHHRSHPRIAGYCNEVFYGKTLEILTDVERLAVPRCREGTLAGFRWTHVPADATQAPGKGAISPSQVEAIVEELKRLAADRFPGTVGVVCPFRIQTNRINDRVSEVFGPDRPVHWHFHAGTADDFQGSERDVILLSLVGGPDMPRGAEWFLRESPNRFNVAVSRARAVLHVFGDKEWARTCGIVHIKRLVEAVEAVPPEDTACCRPDLVGPVWEPRFAEALSKTSIPFREQYPACGRFLDFAIIRPGRKIDVEIDGEQWHREPDGRRKIEDLERDIALIANDWKVKRFWVYQLRENMDACIQEVRRLWEE